MAIMELSKNFEPAAIEIKWNKHWANKKYFSSTPDNRKPFTVVIPPPNVTGVLHMGHTLNETVQDILIRKARMLGFNACWVPGSDHASIATEAKVVAMLKERGIEKKSLTRNEFLHYAFEWKEKYGNIIYNQIERLGCSVDWDRTTFTMDKHYYDAVIKVFVNLYNKGLIYRGARMINWDVAAKTALSDEEVEYKDVEGKLYYVKYQVDREGDNTIQEYITIATQRPETIMGDTGICVNPNDERYTKLKGKYAIVPLVNRRVPIIFDEYVDPAFGTGALKVTPAHDINDYNLGLKYQLEIINKLNEDGTLSEAAQVFVGEERFIARKKTVKALAECGLLIKDETYTTRLGYSQRTGVVVEPRISTQWFLKMSGLAQPALQTVVNGDIRIHPGDKFLATYKYWLENVKDWCISRQLWWGQQIPAWYDNEGNMIVAENEQDALLKYEQQTGKSAVKANLTQDPDVLDTWFSSWLWPMEVFHGISNPGNPDIKYYYPTSVLVTGQDIIFFWVARMIMAGMEFEKQIPFSDVYFTGMVRDKQGRKMSKSLGNSPDLLELINKYGADAVRFGIMISSPAGNDLLFDEASLEQGRNFNNKMWNALKLVKMWQEKGNIESSPSTESFAVLWFKQRLEQAKTEVDELMSQWRLSEALKNIYSLIWDDFCSWYLEWIKPASGEKLSTHTYEQTKLFFTELLHLLHPFMPFITEEIYHLLDEREIDLCIRQYSTNTITNTEMLQYGITLQKTITAIRDCRNKNHIKPKEPIHIYIMDTGKKDFDRVLSILQKQVNATSTNWVSSPPQGFIPIMIDKNQIFIEPTVHHDNSHQKGELTKELEYLKGFLASVEKKLNNQKFIQNARPEVVAIEKKKKSDAETKIKVIEESLLTM